MRVLVTGGRGFVGALVAQALRAREHEVVAVGRAEGDLAAGGVAEALLAAHEPDAVVHLAARVGRTAGELDPARTIRDNVVATALLARACAAGGRRLAYGSTSEVYGPTGPEPVAEDAPLGTPDSLYGLTKRWGEEAASHWCPDATLLRLCFPYGPGVPPGAGAIATMLRQAESGQRIPAYRGVVRSWCFVGDAARAVTLLVEGGHEGAWNIGRDDDPQALVEVARLACRLTGAPETLVEEIEPPAGAARAHRVSSGRLRGLGWRPTVELEDGMRSTLEWLRSGGDSAATSMQRP